MCTYTEARKQLFTLNHREALAIAGPLLERDFANLRAWRVTALALAGLGRREAASRNLRSLAEAALTGGDPILAIVAIKDIEEMGDAVEDLVENLAGQCGIASSDREAPDAPPPLGANVHVTPWPPEEGEEALADRGERAMAAAWGEALTRDPGSIRRYVPLLAAMGKGDLKGFVNALKRTEAPKGERIVEQGAEGDTLYLIAEGEVEVVLRSHRDGTEVLATLGQGSFFGEMSLVSNATRSAEARAREDCVLLTMSRADIEEIATRSPALENVLLGFCHKRMLENLMRIAPVLRPVPEAKRADLLSRFTTDHKPEGAVIIEEGSHGPGLFLIVSGEVQVSRGVGEDNLILANLGPGDLFGEISTIMRKPTTATVTAVENTAYLFLRADRFMETTAAFPELLKGAFDIAVERENSNSAILARETMSADDFLLP